MVHSSVKDMPASCSHRPFDTRLIQPFPQGDIFFQPQRFGISRENAAHIIEFLFLGVLGNLPNAVGGLRFKKRGCAQAARR